LHAFSAEALSLQEDYVKRYAKQFVRCLEKEAHEHSGAVDFLRWVNYLTADIIGDLSFGKSFGGLDVGQLHPWLETVFTTLKTFTLMKEVIRLPSILVQVAMSCIPKEMLKHRKDSVASGAEAAKRRMMKETDRPDCMSYILRHNGDDGTGYILPLIYHFLGKLAGAFLA
jgi:aspirochlorine biosynthesis cytochrome P450 monooxygenase